jgi:putative ABC transport system permease protein
MGFTNLQMLALVLAESCLLAGLGGGAGLAAAWFLISAGDPTGGALPMFYFPSKDMVLGTLLTAALGLATGLFPALQAMRLRIAEALRKG